MNRIVKFYSKNSFLFALAIAGVAGLNAFLATTPFSRNLWLSAVGLQAVSILINRRLKYLEAKKENSI